MPNSVHRAKLEVVDFQTVSLTGPPISVGATREDDPNFIDLWFEHVEDAEPHEYSLYILGTGHPAPWAAITDRSAYRFLGTVIYSYLVWHAYLYIPEVAAAWKNSIAALGQSLGGTKELNAVVSVDDSHIVERVKSPDGSVSFPELSPERAAEIEKAWHEQ